MPRNKRVAVKMSPTHDVKIKELMALSMAIVFSYVGAVVSFLLAGNYSALNPPFEVFWWIGGVCWFLALVLPARFGYRLAKRQGWDGVIVTVLTVIPWLVITVLAILFVVRLASCLEGC
jgi:hypothetical protein